MPKTTPASNAKKEAVAPGEMVPCSNCGNPASVPPDAKPGQRLFCATCTAAWQAGPLPRRGR